MAHTYYSLRQKPQINNYNLSNLGLLALATVMSLVLVLGMFGASASAVTGTASTPVSDGNVTPYIISGSGPANNPNRDCSDVGNAFFNNADYYQHASIRFDEGAQLAGTAGPITWTTSPDGKIVSWNGNHSGLAVIVKGSDDANIYVYDADLGTFLTADTGLASPLNNGGNTPGLSNIAFCWNPAPEVLGQWCSPGYWRQPHHLDSWEATGIAPTELYSDYFEAVTLSKKAVKDGASADPTLLQVLQSPQWYGGEVFNNVGDLLSEAHPGVAFNGERVEDSCPLN